MASLLHFEEKVHKRRLTRADTILLLFPRLLCHVLAHMGFPADPHSETRRHCRESFSLDQWNQVLHHQHSQNFPSQGKFLHSPYHLYLLRPLQLPRSPYQRQHRLMPHLLFLLPRAAHYYPGAEYRDLLASFQTLTTTRRPLWSGWTTSSFGRTSRLSFSVRFSSTSVFCHQLPLFLLCPQSLLLQLMILIHDDATPVAVPSTVAAEDPSYPPEEPTT
ncbi:hypothetical protein CK203_109361 [Vitis vinifera]|uniref:Uncharacterized protein n=1 Tax=Vitis vinifera TaxID=29760 RepID=A0A438FHB1_VITVI|nr:hypothetical protein CK203_109361 [Vitis vinifera]